MGTEKRQILIVDDVELNRAILAELFQDSYEVLEAENGCQALELLEAHHDAILIVLLDIIMPVMDGFEMLQNMAHRTWKEEIPVVLITSENSDNALLKGYELGVSDIINKPFNPNIVKRRVDNTIELYLHKRHLEALVRQQVETLEKQTLKLNRFNEFIIDTLSTVVEFRSCESAKSPGFCWNPCLSDILNTTFRTAPSTRWSVPPPCMISARSPSPTRCSTNRAGSRRKNSRS